MFTSKYWHPAITADTVCIQYKSNQRDEFVTPYILLIRRKNEPFQGKLALPGGFMEETDKDFRETARRELKEETGLDVLLTEIGCYSDIDRDPRERVISFAYLTLMTKPLEELTPIAQDDAIEANWYPLYELDLNELAFDHKKIVMDAIDKICSKYHNQNLLRAFTRIKDKFRGA